MAVGLTTNQNSPEDTVNTLIMGYYSKDVSGSSDWTLSDTEATYPHIEITGTLTGAINVIFPTDTKGYWFYNNTSGAFTVTAKMTGATGITVTQGTKVKLVCDGTDIAAWTAEL